MSLSFLSCDFQLITRVTYVIIPASGQFRPGCADTLGRLMITSIDQEKKPSSLSSSNALVLAKLEAYGVRDKEQH